jgi:integrase
MIPKEVTGFLDEMLGRSPKTKENYEVFVRIFWESVNKPIADITVEDIMGFLNDGVKNKGWKLSTMKQYATVAQLFFGELRDESFKKALRKQLRRLPRVQSKAALYEGIYIPSDKIDLFISLASDEEWAVFYTMVLKWGLRLQEALTFSPSAVDPNKSRVIIRGKGFGGMAKVRQVFVEKSTMIRVLKFAGCSQEQIEGSKPIRDQAPVIKTIKERTAEYQWKKTAKLAGLPHWKKLTVHDGRHSYAIDFLIRRKKEGMAALVLLKNQLGHTNINTTMIYLDIAGGEAQDVFVAGFKDGEKVK